MYARWSANGYTLTVNPNGGTWNGTTNSSQFTQNYGTTKAIANPTPPAGYKVTFNGNGGSTPSALTSTKTFSKWTLSGAGSFSGTTYTFGAGDGTLTASYTNGAITLPTPTKEGYTFAGWYTAASGGSKIGNGGASYTPTAAITLYAQWTANGYTLTVNPSGGTWNNTTSNSTFSQNYGTTKTIENPTPPAGYTVNFNGNGISNPSALVSTKTFDKWTLSGAGSFSGTTYTFGAGNGTLTASYRNGAIVLPSVTREGYTFNGWYTALTGGSLVGKGGTSYTPTSSTTLYARWTANSYTLTVNPNGGTWNNTTSNSTFTQNYGTTKAIANPTPPAGYKVTFDGNGGSTPAALTSTKTFSKWTLSGKGSLSGTTFTFGAGDGTLTASYTNGAITLPTPTREGYKFVGWYTDKTAGTLAGTGGAKYTPTAAVTLYARWTVNGYTLTVNPSGGTWNGTTSASQFTQNYGTTKAIANPTPPAGYKVTFNGNGGSTPSALTSTKTFSKWTLSGAGSFSGTTYTFGEGDGTLTASYTNGAITLPTPTREGYTFNGWYTAASGGSKIGNGGARYTPTAAITLYAQWTINSYKLTVNPNGGTWNGTTASSTFTQNYGTTKTLTNPTPPAGYKVTFNGNGGSTPSALTSTKTFSKWTLSGAGSLSGLTYTFGAGNGTLTASYTNGAITLPTPTRTGYTFAGWYTAASGGSKIGNGGASYTPTAAITLYAHWTANTYTVKYNGNGSTSGSMADSKHTYGVASNLTANAYSRKFNVTYNLTDYINLTQAQRVNPDGIKSISYNSSTNTNTVVVNGVAGWEHIYYPLNTVVGRTYTVSFDFEADKAPNSNGINVRATNTIPSVDYENLGGQLAGITISFSSSGNISSTKKSFTFTATSSTTYFEISLGNLTDYNQYTFRVKNLLITSGVTNGQVATATSTFAGWATSASGSVAYADKASVTSLTATNNGVVNLYAKWNNGSVTLPTPVKSGYVFDGWYTAASGGSKVGAGGASYTPTAAITLYARWKDTTAPTITTPTSSSIGVNGFTVSTNVADYGSGTNKIIWYYKKSTDSSWQSITDTWGNINGSLSKSKTLTGLTNNTTYNVYAVVYDAAGNSKQSSTISVKTLLAVAMTNTTEYASLQAAFNAVPTNNTSTPVKMLQNVTESATLTANRIADFNLNYKTITGTTTIQGGATLWGGGTLQNSSGNTINNTGTLNVNGGSTVKTTGSYIGINSTGGNVNLYGGTVTGDTSNTLIKATTGQVYVEYGTVEITGSKDGNGILVENSATFRIAGGTIKGSNEGTASLVKHNSTGTSTISGGTITKTSKNKSASVVYLSGSGRVNISGGEVTSDYGTVIDCDSTGIIDISGTASVRAKCLDNTYSHTIANRSTGQVYVNGGTVYSKAGIAINNYVNGYVCVNNGSVISDASGYQTIFCTSQTDYSGAWGYVDIKGGRVENNGGGAAIAVNYYGWLTLYGGTVISRATSAGGFSNSGTIVVRSNNGSYNNYVYKAGSVLNTGGGPTVSKI